LDLPEREFEAVRKNIAYINQYPVAFPMSLHENIGFGLKYWEPSISRTELNDRIELALKDIGLWTAVSHRMQENPSDLSAGQLQKLCLARALVLKPEILLLDEPCAYIDPRSAFVIEESIVELKKNCSLVVVTHNRQQAARISDKSSFFNMDSRAELGVLVETSDTEKMFTAPKEKSTEDYITGRFG
jgi:phosphate transport system ATP-binding protein